MTKTVMQHIPISALLVSEASAGSRLSVPAPEGTKAGEFVEYALRGKKYIALTDERHGKVLIQPHNCVMSLAKVKLAAITEARTSVEQMQQEDDAYGIIYVDSPIA